MSGLGFFGSAPAAHAYALSSVETLSVWSLQQGVRLQHFDQIRREPEEEEAAPAAPAALLAAAPPPPAPSAADGIDFLVGCQWDAAAQKLSLVAGEHGGTAHLLRVEADALTVEASLRPGPHGGHSSGVRSFLWGGASLLTGGEDGRLCLWGEPSPGLAAPPLPRAQQPPHKMSAPRAQAPGDARRRAPY